MENQTGIQNNAERYKHKVFEEWMNPDMIAVYRKWSVPETAFGQEVVRLIVEQAQSNRE